MRICNREKLKEEKNTKPERYDTADGPVQRAAGVESNGASVTAGAAVAADASAAAKSERAENKARAARLADAAHPAGAANASAAEAASAFTAERTADANRKTRGAGGTAAAATPTHAVDYAESFALRHDSGKQKITAGASAEGREQRASGPENTNASKQPPFYKYPETPARSQNAARNDSAERTARPENPEHSENGRFAVHTQGRASGLDAAAPQNPVFGAVGQKTNLAGRTGDENAAADSRGQGGTALEKTAPRTSVKKTVPRKAASSPAVPPDAPVAREPLPDGTCEDGPDPDSVGPAASGPDPSGRDASDREAFGHDASGRDASDEAAPDPVDSDADAPTLQEAADQAVVADLSRQVADWRYRYESLSADLDAVKQSLAELRSGRAGFVVGFDADALPHPPEASRSPRNTGRRWNRFNG